MMMHGQIKHQQQGENECYLARCAMLAGVALDAVRAVADRESAALGHTTYAQLFLAADRTAWETVVRAVCAAFALPFTGGGHYVSLLAGKKDPDLRGTGDLIVSWPDGSHIVVYQDGVVFDAETPRPLRYRAWLKTLRPGFRLEVKRIK